eukprot:gene5379-6712_t
MKTTFQLVLLISILVTFTYGQISYTSPLSFGSILSPVFKPNITIPWNGTNVQVLNPAGQENPPTILGTCIQLNTSVTNNPNFINYFGGSQYGSLLTHFSCNGQESCVELKMNSTSGVCLMVASVDGFDHVRITGYNGGTAVNMSNWIVTDQGSFSNTLPNATIPVTKLTDKEISLGCFEEPTKNVEYQVLQPNVPVDRIVLCYTSLSKLSEYVMYGLTQCTNTSTPNPNNVTYAVSGYAFTDRLNTANKTGNPGIPGVQVILTLPSGATAFDAKGNPVRPTVTDSTGYYYFDNLPKNNYKVQFVFPSGTTFVRQTTSQAVPDASKVNSNGTVPSIILTNNYPGIASVIRTNPLETNLISSLILRDVNAGIVPPSDNNFLGNIFYDFNGNGIKDNAPGNPIYTTDQPVPGITVTLKTPEGTTLATTTTDPNGHYEFHNITSSPTGYVVTFTPPPGYQITNITNPPPPGQPYTQPIKPSTELWTGIINQEDYCQEFPDIALVCYARKTYDGPNKDEPVLISFPINTTQNLYNISTPNYVKHLATHGEIGAVYGIANHPATNAIYSAAFMKYFSGFGPGGTGAIYKTTLGPNPTTTKFFDLNEVKVNSTYAGADPHHPDPTTYDFGVEKVGKIAFGDLDIVGDTLYTVALNTNELLTININNPTQYTLTKIFNPCEMNPEDWHAFGLGHMNGKVYVGGVCTMESSTVNGTTPVGFIMEAGTSNVVLLVPLNFKRGCKSYGDGYCTDGAYSKWSNLFFDSQPIISDIGFDPVNKDMIISIRDRGGDQDIDVGTYDILKACWDGTKWVLEKKAVCGGVTGQHPLNAGYFGRPDGIDGGEFYDDNFFYPRTNVGHDNLATTAVVLLPGYPSIIGSSLDIDNIGQGAVKLWDNSYGNLTYGFGVYLQEQIGESVNFGKANGLGDIDAICKKL